MTTLKDNAGTTLVTLAYHPAGERASATYANGVLTSYTYDQLGRLTGLTHHFAGTAQDVTYAYDYNPASQIVSRSIGNDLYAFTKSAASTGYGVNGLNQYVQVGAGAVVHDPNGNLTSEGGRTLGYDSENKLICGSSTAGGSPFTVGYDPQGRLRAIFAGASVIGFDMVGSDITTLRINAGPALERYAFGPGVDEPMVGYDNVGTRYYFHADGHGNVVAHSNAAGTATRTIGYDDYGRPSTFASRFLHAGKIHIGTLNAYYNNARFYDYTLGRFLQTDPIGYDDQINLYAYVENDPINQADPTGMASDCTTGSRLPGGAVNCVTIFSAEEDQGGSSTRTTPQGPLAGRSEADRRSAEQINRFIQNPRASFTQTVNGVTMRVQRDGNTVRGTISQGNRTLRFTGRLAEVPGKQAIRIEGLRFTSPVFTTVNSAPTAMTIYTHRNGTLHVITDRPMIIRGLGIVPLVNEPAGDQLLNRR